MKDIIIIGAGINGCLMAWIASHYQCDVLVLEKGGDVASGASSANSAIVHSGHDPKEGTLKAKFNVLGNRMYPKLCADLQVAYQQVGAYVVAFDGQQEAILERLKKQADQRMIENQLIDGKELRERQEGLNEKITQALYLPSTGIITPWEVCIAAMEEAMQNGVDCHFNEEVVMIKPLKEGFEITTNKGSYRTRKVINCAGVFADELAHMIGNDDYHIHPRKGQYYILDRLSRMPVTSVIYPVPSEKGKGVLLVPTIHGNVLLGPNSEFVEDKGDVSCDEQLDQVSEQVHRLMPNLPMMNVIRSFAGCRPSGDLHDFVIEKDKHYPDFIHVACIESPGLASAPAIADYVMKQLVEIEAFKVKETFEKRQPQTKMHEKSFEEKKEWIAQHPSYGHIICRCEQISEGEIVEAIHRKCGARSVKGVKYRVRPGMGRCQGGFCEPQIVKILARELHIPLEEVVYGDEDSPILVGSAKEDLV